MLCASVGLRPVGVRLLESNLKDLEGKLITLPDAVVFVTGEEPPEVLPPEREDEDLLWRLKADLADFSQPFGPDSFLSSAI